jgi:nitroimidazol reductase NimA-like FMN-containing flavoprotein (pyridoxamine 5'-phosphate oxidase superfamily)
VKPTPRTTIHRKPARGSYDRDVIYGILDAGLVAHVGYTIDDQPYVIPMVYGRLGDELVLHGAIASRTLGAAVDRLPLCATVTIVDGLVLAQSWMHHSMNYRSVVVLGRAREITHPEAKRVALSAVIDHAIRGRSAEARPPNDKELNATRVIALPIEEASAKQRAGGPLPADAEDAASPAWAGVMPLRWTAGPPIAERPRTELPSSAESFLRLFSSF